MIWPTDSALTPSFSRLRKEHTMAEALTPLNCRPHINGNSPEDFHAACQALHTALNAVGAALQGMNANMLHGRNYQHMGTVEGHEARNRDTSRMHVAQLNLEKLRLFSTAALMALKESE